MQQVLDKLRQGRVDDAIKDYEYIAKHAKDPIVKAHNLIRLGSKTEHITEEKTKSYYLKAYSIAHSINNKSLQSLCL